MKAVLGRSKDPFFAIMIFLQFRDLVTRHRVSALIQHIAISLETINAP